MAEEQECMLEAIYIMAGQKTEGVRQLLEIIQAHEPVPYYWNRADFLQLPQPSKMVPLAGKQAFKSWAWRGGAVQIQNIT